MRFTALYTIQDLEGEAICTSEPTQWLAQLRYSIILTRNGKASATPQMVTLRENEDASCC